ncbi:phosphoribosylformylglycinamidine synthase subunit PurL [Ammonifex thiophilus]|uniref:Phosphoribosylformylglycinamidine synthase subunit PurL n=1 Tax=Ammonifex thiophilus TaxID=444093 RepID=A0A3D8P3F4_9THEO|nr:phosphoribosylformylglycinamidine synthase subunit PurL [Ammonifex thiophilus]RDV81305.1 phosphoribosylformylglycinamidine synthase subunit PurL [Ammonifex thiophilus]
MALQEVRVTILPHLRDPSGEGVLHEIRQSLGITSVEKVRTVKVYRFEGIGEEEARFLAERLLCEPVFQHYTLNRPIITDASRIVEVAYRPGVMNPEAASLMKAARDLGVKGLLAADSSVEYAFYGALRSEELELIIKRLLVNETIQHVLETPPRTLLLGSEPGRTQVIPIRQMSDEELLALSADRLFLNLEEMRLIQQYFREKGRDPTDAEVELLAQTWSEHCAHKTFKAKIIVNGQEKLPFLTRLRQATERVGREDLVLSAFVDNAGVMAFYEGWAICGKVETHNAPSAIEPYGGAATGSGGVFRDVMGTGQGAKVIASTDMFCFAPPDTPPEEVPPGCLHPQYLLRRVVAGVRDYGNRMGVPTNNGSVHFHPDFRAKPTVIVGAYGLLPAARAAKGRPLPGDAILVVGGRTGRDGIHGATFSSAAMTDRTLHVHSQAVQIGHPIEEKRMADALLAARDEGLIRAITDCGAGGFASAVGEMGAETGARLYLDRVPLKYSGLAPWEILLSESQERMVVAVDPAKVERFIELCRFYNVEATVIGEFTSDRRFQVFYGEERVVDIEMDFLHRGLPQRVLSCQWTPPERKEESPPPVELGEDLLCRILGHLNVCSKEPIVRMYDHGVQGTNALPPYGGIRGDAPNDAVLLTPLLGKPYAVVISHGLNPVLNRLDPYWGALWAATEAVANAVAVGADPRELCLIDNFIWPVPEGEFLAWLDRAVDACVDFSLKMGLPFISGKDSLSSTYRSGELVIHIPPVVCISAFGRLPDVGRTVSSDFKGEGNLLVLVGARREEEMGGSVYYELRGIESANLPRVDLELLPSVMNKVHRAIAGGVVLSAHDISEGGLFTAVAEMAFGGGLGAEIVVPEGSRPDFFLFNETAGCFVLELKPGASPEELFAGVPFLVLGRTLGRPVIKARWGDKLLFSVNLDVLRAAYQAPLKEVFG